MNLRTHWPNTEPGEAHLSLYRYRYVNPECPSTSVFEEMENQVAGDELLSAVELFIPDPYMGNISSSSKELKFLHCWHD
ncbi:Hypothetical protein FKW44_005063 [Caligus rogercresseyi]|uniref:Uncharacterized protein n=1 Tax=Caligus rogercresseyi TaxID=217165 RepID=A0A7T8QRP2_CALRO|nr:Hypothetical protein FKW44_005063 [Caligus rogercresseyi]